MIGCGEPENVQFEINKMYNSSYRSFDLNTFLKKTQKSDVVLLGESHQNAEHHLAQAKILKQIVIRGQSPTVIMEMISADQIDALNAYRNGARKDANDLAVVLRWNESGWPNFNLYAPVFEEILKGDLPLRHGAPELGVLHSWRSKNPIDDIGEPYDFLRNKFGSEKAIKVLSSWKDQIYEAHCGIIDEEDLYNATVQQMRRDKYLAHQIDKALLDGAKVVVVIAGSSHTRYDRGIPLYLNGANKSTSLYLKEINSNKVDRINSFNHDYIWLTDSSPKDDTCDKLNRLLGRN